MQRRATGQSHPHATARCVTAETPETARQMDVSSPTADASVLILSMRKQDGNGNPGLATRHAVVALLGARPSGYTRARADVKIEVTRAHALMGD